MFRFLKADVVGENTGKRLMAVELSKPKNQLTDQLIEVGETTCKKATKKLRPRHEKGLRYDVRMFYQTTTKYLMNRLPLGRGILKDLSCLNTLLQKESQDCRQCSELQENFLKSSQKRSCLCSLVNGKCTRHKRYLKTGI